MNSHTESAAPTVSVVVPTYNSEETLGATLESVFAQSFEDFEVLVIDDGSTDASGDIARSFTDPRLRIIRQENRGLPGARNTGIREARGRYVALLDADDLWTSNKLREHVEHLDAAPGVGVSFSWSAFIDEASRPLGYAQRGRTRAIGTGTVLCRNPVGNGSAAVVRREVFEAVAFAHPERAGESSYFDESFRQSEDIEFWSRVVLTTDWGFEGIAKELTLYRVHSSGLSASTEVQLENWERVFAKIQTYAPLNYAQWYRLAKAYQLRYLARRAVRSREGSKALRLMLGALRSDLRCLLWEPRRTLSTAAATALLTALPESAYSRLERLAMRIA